ncbi:RteC domain-containing protein [Chryseobacterium daeguense]|uniref:RteC domain-containing protein n=1 Tax=Chryseobacterium daeguense TaxID=412438 RepID=UPI0009D716A5|nr:RteC domain-containing protein [Chryseobacterium daeguense]
MKPINFTVLIIRVTSVTFWLLRTDLDHEFFELGKIKFNSGLSSYVFEIDYHFSTYYNYKVARIIAYPSTKILKRSI